MKKKEKSEATAMAMSEAVASPALPHETAQYKSFWTSCISFLSPHSIIIVLEKTLLKYSGEEGERMEVIKIFTHLLLLGLPREPATDLTWPDYKTFFIRPVKPNNGKILILNLLRTICATIPLPSLDGGPCYILHE